MFQSKCSYQHNDNTTQNLHNNNTIKDIESLKAEIAILKEENDKKINILVKVHLRELEELNKEIITNKDAAVAALEIKDAELAESIILNIEKYEEIKRLKETIDERPTNLKRIQDIKSQIEVLKV